MKYYDYKVKSRIECLLNSSVSKQSYSFSKEPRFKTRERDDLFRFYNLPDIKSKASIYMGTAKRFPELRRSTSTGFISFRSSFDPKLHNSLQYSFGIRHANSKNKTLPDTPGPKYDIRGTPGRDGPKFSFAQKLVRSKTKTEISPGPARYDISEKKSIGNYTLSKFRSYGGFKIGKGGERFGFKLPSYGPGPGGYSTPYVFGKEHIFNSTIRSTPFFSILGRKESIYKNRISCSPGAGRYNRFSEFSGFDTSELSKFLRKTKY